MIQFLINIQIGLRYGTLPLVSRTGGLADTVIDANDAAVRAGAATGFQFSPVDAETLAFALERALALYRQTRTWKRMVRCAMSQDVSWDSSAKDYMALYESLIRS